MDVQNPKEVSGFHVKNKTIQQFVWCILFGWQDFIETSDEFVTGCWYHVIIVRIHLEPTWCPFRWWNLQLQATRSPANGPSWDFLPLLGASLKSGPSNHSKPNWLVVWTPLKIISQLGWLFPIHGKTKNVPNHQPPKVTWKIGRPMVLVYPNDRKHPEIFIGCLFISTTHGQQNPSLKLGFCSGGAIRQQKLSH